VSGGAAGSPGPRGPAAAAFSASAGPAAGAGPRVLGPGPYAGPGVASAQGFGCERVLSRSFAGGPGEDIG